MLLAEISDAVWLGLFGLLSLVVKEYFDRERNKEVKSTLHKQNVVAAEQNEKLADVKEGIMVVTNATDGIKNELVAEVRKASYLTVKKDAQESK